MEILVQHLVGKRHIIIAVRGGDRELTSPGDRVNQWKEHLGVEYQILLHGLWMTSIIAGAVLLAVSQIFYFFIYFFFTLHSLTWWYLHVTWCYLCFVLLLYLLLSYYCILFFFFNLTFFCCMWFIILSVSAAVQIAPRGTIMIWINNLNQNQLTLILKVKTYVKKSPTHFQHPREAETAQDRVLLPTLLWALILWPIPVQRRWILRVLQYPLLAKDGTICYTACSDFFLLFLLTILHLPILCTKTISSIINMLC